MCIENPALQNGEVPFQQVDLQLYTFQLNEEGSVDEMADDAEELAACKQWILPCKEFDGLWERYGNNRFIFC